MFGESHDAFRASFRDFLNREVVPFAEEWATAGCVARSAWKAAGREGFLCPTLAARHGGRGLDFLHSIVICEELARVHELGFGMNLHSDVVVPYIEHLGSDEIQARWLPSCVTGNAIGAIAITEPGGGSDLAAIQATAEYDATRNGYVLDGRKVFIANGELCDFVIVVARTAPDPSPQRALSLFLVDTSAAGFARGRKLRKIGFASQDTHELLFERCFVPASALLGRRGAGLFHILRHLQQERLIVAATAQARAEQILEETIAYAKTREINAKPLSAFQNTAFRLAECAAKVEVGRAFVDRLCAEHLTGEYLQKECAIAKLWHTEMLGEVADACLQLWGAAGCLADHGVGRAYVDGRLQRIYAGTNEVMKLIIANELGLG